MDFAFQISTLKKKFEKSKCENGKEEFYQRLYEKKHDQVDQL